MTQRGVSLLEAIVVIAISLITSALVGPSIGNWRANRSLEADYLKLVSQIDYLKTRARVLNGTSLLICNGTKLLTYQISTAGQFSTSIVSPGFATKIVENPTATNAGFNILSGDTTIVSAICSASNTRAILNSNGVAGVEGSASAIDIEINRNGNREPYGAYRIVVNQTTGFVQKFKWNKTGGTWLEQD